MREVWDVYTKDRKKTGKTCIRGEQGQLSEDEFHLWITVWIKNPETGRYLISQRSADKETDPLNGKLLQDILYQVRTVWMRLCVKYLKRLGLRCSRKKQ